MMLFYFRDGRLEWHRVVRWDDEMQRPPGVWLIREYPPHEITAAYVTDLHVIERRFRRVDYRYPPGFIGPTRESEYHEESAVLR